MLIDRFGRRITNLRMAVTSKCNLSCIYCHKEGEINPGRELSVEEIRRISEAFYQLGIKKLKITGGEPLLRKDIVEIVQSLPPFKEVSMTTNGVLLADLADELGEAGLDRVNVSLDTLNAEKYRFITGGDIEDVLEGIEAAYNAKLTPIKVNMVVMKGVNDDEVEDMLEFTSKFNRDGINVILQIIELLKLPELEKYYVDISPIEKAYAEQSRAVLVRNMHRRKQYILGNSAIEFVKPLDNSEFCMHCNRIRVTSDGKVKPCLLRNDNLVDVRNLEGEELIAAIKNAVGLREPYFRCSPE
jgi:cyclic pyranopterin phosphate synthase